MTVVPPPPLTFGMQIEAGRRERGCGGWMDGRTPSLSSRARYDPLCVCVCVCGNVDWQAAREGVRASQQRKLSKAKEEEEGTHTPTSPS